MHRNLLAGLTVAAILQTAGEAAEPHWTRLTSSNFEMYTTASAPAARDVLNEFEQVHDFFAQVFGVGTAQPVKVRLVAFSSAKEYEPYRLNDFAVAHYHQTPDRDYIVMSQIDADVFPVVVHEYVHLLLHRAGYQLPVWLDEGLAEVYSTLRPKGGSIVVGDLISGRYRALLNNKWVPLAAILAADHHSPSYNEKEQAGSFYNESWALTHMLFFNPHYRPKFSELLKALRHGGDSQAALIQIYGRTVRDIEKDLLKYLEGFSFRAISVPAKLQKSAAGIPVEPLANFDAALMLADLNDRPGREITLRTQLQWLTQEAPDRPEPYRKLGYFTWRVDHNNEEALRCFGKAYELGDHEPDLLWDYGRLLEDGHDEQAAPVLTELLAKDPERMEVRLELAALFVRLKQPKATLQLLADVHTVGSAEAGRFFRTAVTAHLVDGDQAGALAAAERFLNAATTDEQRAEARRLMRTVTPDHAGNRRVARQVAEGRFADLTCDGSAARLTVETADGKQVFLIEDPHNVTMHQGATEAVELKCGAQAALVEIRVEYDLPAAGQTGIQGVARVLRFE